METSLVTNRTVELQSLGGDVQTYPVNVGDTVHELRSQIAAAWEVPPPCVHLLIGEHILEDGEAAVDLCGVSLVGLMNFPGLRISFQPQGLQTPSGYIADSGEVYGHRCHGWEFGWTFDNQHGVRQRGRHDNILLDTLCIPDRNSQHGKKICWKIQVPTGSYRVTLGIGDALYSGSYIGTVNKVPFRTLLLDASNFQELDVIVHAEDMIELVGSWPDLSSLCYIHIALSEAEPASPPPPPCSFDAFPDMLKISFQPDIPGGSPSDYAIDCGQTFDKRQCGLEYGWTEDNTANTRRRLKNHNLLLDTLCIPDREGRYEGNLRWRLNAPSGMYTIVLGVGDAQYPGTYAGTVNSVPFNARLRVNQFIEVRLSVKVADTIEIAGCWPDLSSLCYIHVARNSVTVEE